MAHIRKAVFPAAGKGSLEDYFDAAAALEPRLQASGKTDALAAIDCTGMAEGAPTIPRQSQPLGLGHAVRQAKILIGDEAFAVILPDDVFKGETSAMSQMVEAHRNLGGHMVATMDVPRSDISKFGVLDVASQQGRVSKALGLVEKPCADLAPSSKAVIGCYILDRAIFDQLDDWRPGAGGELQLTDTINGDVPTVGVNGFTFEGERYDCGSAQGYLQATTAFVLGRADLQDEYSNFLSETRQSLRLVA